MSYIKNLLKKIAYKILKKEIEHKDSTIDKLYSKIAEKEHRKSIPVIRLDRGEFNRVRKLAYPMVVNGQTTELQAAALVGQQHVFDLIERELVRE